MRGVPGKQMSLGDWIEAGVRAGRAAAGGRQTVASAMVETGVAEDVLESCGGFSVGQEVIAQHRTGGRLFRSTIRRFHKERNEVFVQVVDPRNGGVYLIPLGLIRHVPSRKRRAKSST